MPTLQIDIVAKLASFQDSLEKIGRQSEQMANRLSSAFGAVRSSVAALGAGLSVGAFAGIIKGAIDAADELDDLSQKVGISVERLSELKFLLDVEGVSTDQLQQGVKALSDALVKANDATSKEAQLLKTLGVNARDPYEALRQLADAFAALPDSAEKTTVAADLLGKAGLALIPALNGGSKAIDAAAESARKLGLTLSAETAAKAAEFNDNMKKLSLSAGALGIALSGRVVGGLAEFTRGIVKAKEEGQAINKIMNDVLGTILELNAKLPIVGGAFAAIRDRNAQRLAEEQDSIRRRTATGTISGGFVGPPVPADLQDRLRAFYASQNKPTGPRQLSIEEIIANSRLLRLRREEDELEEADKEAAQAEKDRLQSAFEAAQERARLEDEQIAKLAELAARNRELGQTYIDLIDPVAKYRRQLEEIDKLERLAPSEGGLTSSQAELARERVLENVRKLATETDKAKSAAEELGLTFASAFEDAIVAGKKFSDVLKGLGQDIARILIRRSITEPLANEIGEILKPKGGGKNPLSSLFDIGKSLFGFANGGSFTVGGSGGIDSQVVAFRATPGERVDVRTPGQQSGGTVVNNYNYFVDVDAAVRQQIAQATPAIVSQAVAQVADLRRRGVPV